MSKTPIPGSLIRTTFNTLPPERVVVAIRPHTSGLAKAALFAGLALIGYCWVRLAWLMHIRPQMIENWHIIQSWFAGLFS